MFLPYTALTVFTVRPASYKGQTFISILTQTKMS